MHFFIEIDAQIVVRSAMLEYAYIPRNTVSYYVVEISTGHARNNENNIKTTTAEHQTGNTGSYYPFDVFDQVNY